VTEKAAAAGASSAAEVGFIRIAVVVGVGLVLFVAFVALGIGGLKVNVAVEDIGEAVAAALAAAACLIAARRASGRNRLAWGLLGASTLSWAVGEVVWSIYEVGLGDAVPFPSLADLGFLLAVPLAIAGLLSFPIAPRRANTRARSIVDGAIVAFSLLFVCWAFVLGPLYQAASSDPLAAQLIGLAYPIGDILIASVVIIIAGRASGPERPRYLLLLGGFLAFAVADSAFAYLTASAAYTVKGSVLDSSWVVGFVLIGLAALLPASGPASVEAGPLQSWQVALPGIAFAAATASAFVIAATGQDLGIHLTVLASGLGLLLVVSNLLALADAAHLRQVNGLAEAMLRRIDLPLPSSPISAFSIDSEGQLVFSQGPVLERMQRSDEKEAASLVSLSKQVRTINPDLSPRQGRDAVRITELEGEIAKLRQANGVLMKVAGFAAADEGTSS
jgi:cytochrome c oxidase assembly factor CtaG